MNNTRDPSSPLLANLNYMSRGARHVQCTLATRRPWRHVFTLRSLSKPNSLPETLERLRTNLYYFRVNFAMVVLLAVFLSLIYHPVSLMVFVGAMPAWLYFFFLQDEPLVLFGRLVDDRLVLAVLAGLTLIALLLTSATFNVLLSLLLGVLLLLLYSVFRRTQDLFLDEEAASLVDRPETGGGLHP